MIALQWSVSTDLGWGRGQTELAADAKARQRAQANARDLVVLPVQAG